MTERIYALALLAAPLALLALPLTAAAAQIVAAILCQPRSPSSS